LTATRTTGISDIQISDIQVGKRFRKNIGDISELAKSISEIGLLQPIVVVKENGVNKLAAGQRRIKAFESLGRDVIPAYVIDLDDLKRGERDENTIRLDFAPDEIEEIYRYWKPEEEAKAKERKAQGQKKGGTVHLLPGKIPESNPEQKQARDEIGKIVGKSGKWIEQNHFIHEMASKYPNRKLGIGFDNRTYGKLVDDVDKGISRVSKAYAWINQDLRLLEKKAEAEQAIKDSILSDKIRLLNMDLKDITTAEIQDNSVDLILTDPPYSNDSLPLYEDLAKLASSKLKDGGSLVFYFARQMLPEILDTFSEHASNLVYWWMLAVKHESSGVVKFHPRGVRIQWKPMLWFVKGDKKLVDRDLYDFVISSPPDKDKHPWAQSSSEAQYITENLTISEHSVVLDPFLGSGAFAIPAIKSGRYFIGVEIDSKILERTNIFLQKAKSDLGGVTK